MRLNAPRVPDPADAPALRWGILGPGWIADELTTSLRHTKQEVVAVGSRSSERASAFAARHGIDPAHAHGSYEALVADDVVDVVYVATPHSEHHEHALLAIAAGRHVLVEKAFTATAAQARAVVDAARAADVFCMEAMWTRFLPHVDVIRDALERGVLGEVLAVHADHGQNLWPVGPRRLADPRLAGGALLDLGIYPLSFAHLVLGELELRSVDGELTPEGVDEWVVATLAAAGSPGSRPRLAHVSTSMGVRTPTTASVCGTWARLDVDGDFYAPSQVRLVGNDGMVLGAWGRAAGTDHGGLRYQAAELARRLTAGEKESPLMPLDDSIHLMELMDAIRARL